MGERHYVDDDDDNDTLPFVRTSEKTRPTPATASGPGRGAPGAKVVFAAGGGLWDSSDVASYLKVSRSWVYHRAEAGLLPYLRVGGLLRFDPDVIRAYARGK